MSMEQSGGEVAAKRVKASESDAGAGGEDRISALPDDALVLILLCLGTKAAGRTSVLSHRWHHVWTLLPELRFGVARDPHLLRDALSASEVPLRCLHVGGPNASPQSLAAWLPAAARRVSGKLLLVNMDLGRKAAMGEEDSEAESQSGAIELPCFEKATSIYLDLGFLGLSVPSAGVFARLINLELNHVRFHGPCELGDAVSSPRCPCLRKLTIHNSEGLDSVTIDSESLQLLELTNLRSVRQVTVVAPALTDFGVFRCFAPHKNQPVVKISAPRLKLLKWVDVYDPSSVHLGSMEHLEELTTFFVVMGPHGFVHNHACLMLLSRFKALKYLFLSLSYTLAVKYWQYLMEDMTILPDVSYLHLAVRTKGHSFGACSFHVLKICSGIKKLGLVLSSRFDLEEQTLCSSGSGCICDQPTNWKTEELLLNHLQELEIEGLRASEHEIEFVKRLLSWAPVMKMITVTFHRSISESKAKELLQMFRSFSRLGLCMKFYIYQEFSKVLYAPED